MKPRPKKGAPEKPKKAVAKRSLEQLEEERRERRLDALNKKFTATIKHMTQVEKVYEDYYQARKDLAEGARSISRRSESRRDGKGRT